MHCFLSGDISCFNSHQLILVYFVMQVISARKGEFETGFDRGGQTREHAMLAKTAGVKHLVVLINKMDDPTVSSRLMLFPFCIIKKLNILDTLSAL